MAKRSRKVKSSRKSIPTDPAELFELAKQGTRVTATDRRAIIRMLDEDGDQGYSNTDLAGIFKVDEKRIREDRRAVAEAMVSTLTPEQAMTFVSRHLYEVDSLIAVAKRGMKSAGSGSMGERAYIETISKLMGQRFGALQEIGIVRKELGNLNVTEEVWEATIADTGEKFVNHASPEAIAKAFPPPALIARAEDDAS